MGTNTSIRVYSVRRRCRPRQDARLLISQLESSNYTGQLSAVHLEQVVVMQKVRASMLRYDLEQPGKV